ncbi:cytochrome P450 [Fistulina hepatica ATCC 64428]|uniref:Cytochrome P450 n=1 Tax=Fistulina hepatica ATCC 64428 TaxID=1128425 RepID=A0A0D7A3G8_9AGAR|nr:cytochrome P450 [Fistulina hepatica ATCC 64428]
MFSLQPSVLSLLAVVFFIALWVLSRKSHNLPPGPKRLPFIGNILNMPQERSWEVFAEWSKIYGPIISLTGLGQSVIVLNTLEAAHDLLDKRSVIYSDRPSTVMAQLCGLWGGLPILMNYGNAYRHRRRLIHQALGTSAAVQKYGTQVAAESRRMMKHLLTSPDNLKQHIHHASSGIILSIAYGYHVNEQNDPLVSLVEAAMDIFSEINAPTAFLVNFLPFLRHIPQWMPGARFKRRAYTLKAYTDQATDTTYRMVQDGLANGTAVPSYTSDLIEHNENEADVKWTGLMLYTGGWPGVICMMYAFYKAMVLFPEVQARAQAELDAVVGSDRLPMPSDRGDLPYIEALLCETLRWHSATPTGVPHRVMEDDCYNGYFIPRGSVVIANTWAISRDPTLYSNPDTFDPTRFLAAPGKKPEQDPRAFVFGHGRRLCSGQGLAELSMFVEISMTLALFNITKVVENGVTAEPTIEHMPGLISHPSPFKCIIKPRNEKAEALIGGEIVV